MGMKDLTWKRNERHPRPWDWVERNQGNAKGNSHHGDEVWKAKKAVGRDDQRHGMSCLQERDYLNEILT